MKLYRYKKDTIKTEELIIKSVCDYLDCDIKPEILRTKNGKPYFKDLNLHIGVTHTDNTVIICFHENNFGIDCEEKSRSLRFSKQIAARYFSPEEKKLPFQAVWTRKEAYAKFLGTRLFNVLSVDTFSLDGNFEFLEDDDLIICIYTKQGM